MQKFWLKLGDGAKVSKDYFITGTIQNEKFHYWIYERDFLLISKSITFSVVSISYRDVRSTGDFFICCKNAMNIRTLPGQTN